MFLRDLDLCGFEKITDVGVQYWAPLTYFDKALFVWLLKYLRWGCKLTDIGIRHLGTLMSLKHLDADSCEEITDASILNLKSVLQSRPVTVSYNSWWEFVT